MALWLTKRRRAPTGEELSERDYSISPPSIEALRERSSVGPEDLIGDLRPEFDLVVEEPEVEDLEQEDLVEEKYSPEQPAVKHFDLPPEL